MIVDADRAKTPGIVHRRRHRLAGGALVAAGVVVSWVWSTELTIAGESVGASLAGAATMLLFCASIVVLRRASPHRGRVAAWAFRAGAIATALGAIVAGVVPIAVVVATTGTATAEVTSGTSGDGYRVAATAVVSSDEYHQTTVDLTVRTSDRPTPQLVATLSFTEGISSMTCVNTRPAWTHEVSTVRMICDDFVPRASLDAISGIAVSER